MCAVPVWFPKSMGTLCCPLTFCAMFCCVLLCVSLAQKRLLEFLDDPTFTQTTVLSVMATQMKVRWTAQHGRWLDPCMHPCVCVHMFCCVHVPGSFDSHTCACAQMRLRAVRVHLPRNQVELQHETEASAPSSAGGVPPTTDTAADTTGADTSDGACAGVRHSGHTRVGDAAEEKEGRAAPLCHDTAQSAGSTKVEEADVPCNASADVETGGAKVEEGNVSFQRCGAAGADVKAGTDALVPQDSHPEATPPEPGQGSGVRHTSQIGRLTGMFRRRWASSTGTSRLADKVRARAAVMSRRFALFRKPARAQSSPTSVRPLRVFLVTFVRWRWCGVLRVVTWCVGGGGDCGSR
mgnify:CR=1 FL=1